LIRKPLISILSFNEFAEAAIFFNQSSGKYLNNQLFFSQSLDTSDIISATKFQILVENNSISGFSSLVIFSFFLDSNVVTFQSFTQEVNSFLFTTFLHLNTSLFNNVHIFSKVRRYFKLSIL